MPFPPIAAFSRAARSCGKKGVSPATVSTFSLPAVFAQAMPDNIPESGPACSPIVGKHGQAVFREPRRIAIGADRDRPDLRRQPFEHMRQHRPAADRAAAACRRRRAASRGRPRARDRRCRQRPSLPSFAARHTDHVERRDSRGGRREQHDPKQREGARLRRQQRAGKNRQRRAAADLHGAAEA